MSNGVTPAEHYPGAAAQAAACTGPATASGEASRARTRTIRSCSTTSTTWSSRPRRRPSACGCSWSPKSCSSAACSWPTSSTGAAAPEAFQEASHHLSDRLGRVQHRRPDRQLADDGAGGAGGADQRCRRGRRSMWLVATMILGAVVPRRQGRSSTPTSSSTTSCPARTSTSRPGQHPAGVEHVLFALLHA